MPSEIKAEVETAFASLIANDEVGLIDDAGELHIAGDDWTLLLIGDPVADVIIALEDETGSPESDLQSAISEEAIAAIRDLDARLSGILTAKLIESPDPLARILAGVLGR